MLISTVPCPQCKQPYPLTTDTVGKAVTCRCGWRFVLPAAVPVVPLETRDEEAPIPLVPLEELPPEDVPVEEVEPARQRELSPDYFGVDSQLTQLPDTEPLPLAPAEPDPEPLEIELVDEPAAPALPPRTTSVPPVSLLPTGSEEGALTLAPVPAIPLEGPTAPLPRSGKAVHYQGGRTPSDERRKALLLGSPMRDFYVPLVLIILGTGMYFARFILFDPSNWRRGMAIASAQMMLNGIITISVVTLTARLTDMDLGTAAGTIMKMTALAVFPNAAAGMLLLTRDNCAGLAGGGLVSIGLNYALFANLFDLEFGAAFLCTALIVFFTVLSWVAVLFFF